MNPRPPKNRLPQDAPKPAPIMGMPSFLACEKTHGNTKPDSVYTHCLNCNAEVGMPSNIQAALDHGVQVYCIECANEQFSSRDFQVSEAVDVQEFAEKLRLEYGTGTSLDIIVLPKSSDAGMDNLTNWQKCLKFPCACCQEEVFLSHLADDKDREEIVPKKKLCSACSFGLAVITNNLERLANGKTKELLENKEHYKQN